jgi:NADPH2:quinone reductase
LIEENPMPKAIRIHEYGGPEVLRWEEAEVGEPGPGQLRVRHAAVGLNYIDVYHRTGLYPLPSLPWTLGMEGAGKVEAVGEGVTEFKVGDRVAYASPPVGAYAEVRLMPADRVVALPDAIDDQTAAAMMLQGMTAQYLLRRTYRVQPGDTILLHAAAGGVGLIASQWARHLGATVIGTVGSDEKAELARAHGCHHVIVYSRENFTQRVREITDGQGVAAVYDSVGQATFMNSLDCLRRLGMMVSFGNASGPVPPFDPGILAAKGSLFLTRPSLMAYTAERADLLASAADLFEVVASGAVKIEVHQTYPLAETAQAHRDLEARKTTGSTVLLP